MSLSKSVIALCKRVYRDGERVCVCREGYMRVCVRVERIIVAECTGSLSLSLSAVSLFCLFHILTLHQYHWPSRKKPQI